MRCISVVQSRSPLLETPKAVSILVPSVTVSEGIWLTMVSFPADSRKWSNYDVLRAFAPEGAYAIQFLTFGEV